MSTECGRRIVDMVWEDLTPNRILTPAAFDNANTVAMATGCSTNAIIHLIAMARRAGVSFSLDDMDRKSRHTPILANIRPIGKEYLMEDFFYAGGLLALLNRLRGRLNLDCLTVNGRTMGQNIAGAEVFNDDVIRPLDNPVYSEGSLAVLRGNLAPDGAVIKPAACDPAFHVHEGPAVVFDSYPELKARLDDESWDITPESVLVLRNAGPQGGPGMPEWGMIPMPKALLKKGYRDMVRLSDARMSGTSYGACILHVAPEAFICGPLALLRNGDIVRLDLPNRRLDMLVGEAELAARKAAWVQPERRYERGYGWMFAQHIQQADKGCDFDYLETSFGAPVREPEIH
jgi:dihydroxy-acid dehydratase